MKRPLLRYFGGKFRIADWVVSHFPPHRQYVEPFGGAASVLLHKSRSYNEIYNDKNGDIVNLFQVIRDPQLSKQLIKNVRLTPYSRDEFDLSYEKTDDPVEKARRIIVRSHFAFSSSGVSRKYKTGFQNTSMRNNADEWADFPEPLRDIINRMIGVTIENTAAVDLITKFDHEDTLFYLDPPYMPSTRSKEQYIHDMSYEDHEILLDLIIGLKGKVVISGYANELYDSVLIPNGYEKRSRNARAQSGTGGTAITEECLWISPSALELNHGLFCMGEAV